jgi:uncharacterized membrane protein
MATFFKPEKQSVSSEFMNSIVDSFKSNLEIVPDILLATIGIFAILLQSPSLTAFGLSMLSVNLVQPWASGFLREIVPSSAAIATRATGKFPGASVERVMLTTSDTKAELPSYYTMFLGALLGWIAPLSTLYAPELKISPQRSLASTISIAFLIMFSVILILYRYLAEQDTPYGIFIGLGLGSVFGFLLVLTLYYGTQRRATNIYNLPLLTTSYGVRDPIYVCASK